MSALRARSLSLRVLDALYPPDVACALCGRETLLGSDYLCAECRDSLSPAPALICPDLMCGIVAGYRYSGGARDGIHALKYKNQVRLAPFFARAIELPSEWRIDCVVPVPLHPLKQWLRSYNQSDLLAQEICQRYHLMQQNKLLRRTRFTKPQARLNAFERARNVSQAFSASPEAKGLNILLVDDVTTTHSTLLSCAVALKAAGAGTIYAACATAATREQEHAEASSL